MATTSLWRIKGTIGKTIDYVENSEKTTKVEIKDNTLDDVIAYAERDNATYLKKYVTGINVDPDKAREQMNQVKRQFDKLDGTIAYHGYQSFKEGEVTPDLAHKIGIELATELWGDKYQVLVCTHLDKSSHLHTHFLINTVSFVDGKKYYRSNEDYKQMQRVSDRLCREHGLSVIKHPGHKKDPYNLWLAEKEHRPTYRTQVRADIDRAISASLTESEFYSNMEKLGYELKFYSDSGNLLKRPSLRPKNGKRFFRFDNLGEDYSIDEINNRVLENTHYEELVPEDVSKKVKIYREEHPPITKAKGIAKLYYYYCYELHIIQKYPNSVKKASALMQEDLRKLDKLDRQVTLLTENNIETFDDLKKYIAQTDTDISTLTEDRNSLRNELRRRVRSGDSTEDVKKSISVWRLYSERDYCTERIYP